ncbi:CxxxxCH/CxxCH domain-containing protein [Lentzea alba]
MKRAGQTCCHAGQRRSQATALPQWGGEAAGQDCNPHG